MAVAEAARRLEGNPVDLAGRALGFAPGEPGLVPPWAWYAVVFVGGALAAGWGISRYPDFWPT